MQPLSAVVWCLARFVAIGTALAAGNPFPLQQTVSKAPDAARQDSTARCPRSLLVDFVFSDAGEPTPGIRVWQLAGKNAVFFEANMAIDADGAPDAYNPGDTGLDDLISAGQPGDWHGLATDRDGNPYLQGPRDPFPGYYVSTTALTDKTKSPSDPARYVDASTIPYIVLPGSVARQAGAALGDFAAVLNLRNNRSSSAIFADIGDNLGEGSIALADHLGVRSSARYGGARSEILYILFPGSGNHTPRTIDEITHRGEKLLHEWGGVEQAMACAVDSTSLVQPEGSSTTPASTARPR